MLVPIYISTNDYKVGQNNLEVHAYMKVYKKDNSGNRIALLVEKEVIDYTEIINRNFELEPKIIKKLENNNIKEKNMRQSIFQKMLLIQNILI